MCAAIKNEFKSVNLASLTVGQLMDRSLYLYFAKSERYLCFVNEFQVLDEHRLEKIQKVGNVFSKQNPIDIKYPNLRKTATSLRKICENVELAPFEKNKAIASLTEWLVPFVLGAPNELDSRPIVFLIYETFKVPKSETLLYLSELSVEMVELMLRVATLSGVIALWLGYSDTHFLKQFIQTVFCEEVALYQWRLDGKLDGKVFEKGVRADQKYLKNYDEVATQIDSGKIPGIEKYDYRFKAYLKANALGGGVDDELYQIVEFVRGWHQLATVQTSWFAGNRVSKKLAQIFGIQFDLESAA